MIPVTLTALTWIYLATFTGVIGLCWAASVWRAHRARAEIRAAATRCRLCGSEFWLEPDDNNDRIVRCPACDAANERIPLRRE